MLRVIAMARRSRALDLVSGFDQEKLLVAPTGLDMRHQNVIFAPESQPGGHMCGNRILFGHVVRQKRT